jgi:DNA excision repair protein ERCC-3
MDYARAEKRERFRIAAENSMKQKAISELLQAHSEDSILIIGQLSTTTENDPFGGRLK